LLSGPAPKLYERTIVPAVTSVGKILKFVDNACNTLAITKDYAHMSTRPDYQKLYETAESQAGYFAARQARGCGFSWERLSGNVKTGRFIRVRRGIYRINQFPGSAFEDLFVA